MTLTFLLVVITVAFGIYVFKFPPKKTPLPPSSQNQSICMDYSAYPMNELQVDLVHEMVKGYQKKQLHCINTHADSLVKNDAYSIWFELETIKRFMYHIEKTTIDTANANGVKVESQDLGVRIYYATYPEIETWSSKYLDLVEFVKDPLKSQYGNLHTLVMVPTIKANGRILDFNPLDYSTYANGLFDRPGYVVTNTIHSTQKTVALSGAANKSLDETAAQNHGNLIPPADTNGLGFSF